MFITFIFVFKVKTLQDQKRYEKNEMMAVETIAKGVKGAYQKPLCAIHSVVAESVICSGSVTGDTENTNVSEDKSDAWYTDQDD